MKTTTTTIKNINILFWNFLGSILGRNRLISVQLPKHTSNQYKLLALRKIPKSHLISRCGNFAEMHQALEG